MQIVFSEYSLGFRADDATRRPLNSTASVVAEIQAQTAERLY
jgi:hypothetical protein